MAAPPTIEVDVAIFGGGAAGLWLLDELRRRGYLAIVLEASQLGAGQTVASQGILHGGLKYSLSGLVSPSARAIRDMPQLWQRCLAGEAQPDLRGVRVRSHYCHLWQSAGIRSKVFMLGAVGGLRIAPRKLAPDERPTALRESAGNVYRVDEQVLEPASLLSVLADRNRDHVFKIDVSSGLELHIDSPGVVTLLQLINPETGEALDVKPTAVVLCAGVGNEELRTRMKLPPHAMQRRPLHMVLARGKLPAMNGHCIDGRATRLTITSTRDYAERTIWQVGGQVAEAGVRMTPKDLILHAFREVRETLPSVNLADVQWATYRVDRAEAAAQGVRPAAAHAQREGNTITAWPTKLVLAPALATAVISMIGVGKNGLSSHEEWADSPLVDWPRPNVALPPWETHELWITDV